MTLRVVGAGLGRTGTTSLRAALGDLLGGPCYHMLDVGERSADPDTWAAAYGGVCPDWREFFRDYRAAVDWPSAPFWRELSEAFPEALILLSVRDPDDWWRSASNTIFIALATYFRSDAPSGGWTAMGRAMMTAFTPDWQNESAAKAAYLAHNEEVRTTAPRGQVPGVAPGRRLGPDLRRPGPSGARPRVPPGEHHCRHPGNARA